VHDRFDMEYFILILYEIFGHRNHRINVINQVIFIVREIVKSAAGHTA